MDCEKEGLASLDLLPAAAGNFVYGIGFATNFALYELRMCFKYACFNFALSFGLVLRSIALD